MRPSEEQLDNLAKKITHRLCLLKGAQPIVKQVLREEFYEIEPEKEDQVIR